MYNSIWNTQRIEYIQNFQVSTILYIRLTQHYLWWGNTKWSFLTKPKKVPFFPQWYIFVTKVFRLVAWTWTNSNAFFRTKKLEKSAAEKGTTTEFINNENFNDLGYFTILGGDWKIDGSRFLTNAVSDMIINLFWCWMEIILFNEYDYSSQDATFSIQIPFAK